MEQMVPLAERDHPEVQAKMEHLVIEELMEAL